MKNIVICFLFICGCAIPPTDYIPVENPKGMTLEEFLSHYNDSELYYKDFAYTVVTRWEWIEYDRYLKYYQFRRNFGEHPQIQSNTKRKGYDKYFYHPNYSCSSNCNSKHIHFTNGLPDDTTGVLYIYRRYLEKPILGSKCLSDLIPIHKGEGSIIISNQKKHRGEKWQYNPTYSCPTNCSVDHIHYSTDSCPTNCSENHLHYFNGNDEDWESDCLRCVEERTDMWIKKGENVCNENVHN